MQAAPRFGYSEPAVARRTPATLKAVSRKAASTGSRARRPAPSRTVKWKGPRARVGERGSNGTRARTPGSAREVHRPARASMGSDRSSRLSRGAARCQRGCMISALPSMLEHIGKYKVLEKIGQGAMGEVYKAHDPILNRFVAVKTISAELGGDDTLRKRFQR